MSEDTKNGEKAVNDGPANPPWRKLPRVAIKDEPEVNAHSIVEKPAFQCN